MICKIKGCRNISDLVFCAEHPKSSNISKDFQTLQNVVVKPTQFYNRKNCVLYPTLETAELMMRVSPRDIKRSRNSANKLKTDLLNSIAHNRVNLTVISLKKTEIKGEALFCSTWTNDEVFENSSYGKQIPALCVRRFTRDCVFSSIN